jgi:hypothetical protein
LLVGRQVIFVIFWLGKKLHKLAARRLLHARIE